MAITFPDSITGRLPGSGGGATAALAVNYHVLGTDKVGQDVLLLSLKSLRTALVIGTLTTLVMLPFALQRYQFGNDINRHVVLCANRLKNFLRIIVCPKWQITEVGFVITNHFPPPFPVEAQLPRSDRLVLVLPC